MVEAEGGGSSPGSSGHCDEEIAYKLLKLDTNGGKIGSVVPSVQRMRWLQ